MFEEEKQEEESKKLKDAAQYRQFQEDIKATFGTSHGKRVLRWLLELGGMWSSLFIGNSSVYKKTGVHDFCAEIVNEVMAADVQIYFDIVQQRVNELKVPGDAEVHDR